MIIFAIADNGYVTVYDDKKKKCFAVKGETVYGYTQSTVTVKNGECYYVYDEKGNLIAKYPWDFIDTSNIAGVII